jgi:hypothetical protein
MFPKAEASGTPLASKPTVDLVPRPRQATESSITELLIDQGYTTRSAALTEPLAKAVTAK